MKLAVGELVVYRSHGAGRVVARKQCRSGEEGPDVVVLELAGNMTVTLPTALAHEQLRPLASERELASVQQTLRTTAQPGESVWLKRHKATRAKLALGDPVGLAEVVSDGNRRHQVQTSGLSTAERQLYLKARQLLANEIALLRDIPAVHADDWIADQLTHAEP